MSETVDAKLLRLRIEADKAEMALNQAVREECPREHRPVQHRDGLPPWCPACGRDDVGIRRHGRNYAARLAAQRPTAPTEES